MEMVPKYFKACVPFEPYPQVLFAFPISFPFSFHFLFWVSLQKNTMLNPMTVIWRRKMSQSRIVFDPVLHHPLAGLKILFVSVQGQKRYAGMRG
jgi:hypothetical protein